MVDWATPEDIVAARPDLSAETVRRLCRQGKIPGAALVGRSWIIPPDDAANFVETYERYGRNSDAPGADGTGGVPPSRNE